MFNLGQVLITRGLNELISENSRLEFFIYHCLKRHQMGEWGDLDDEDKELNNEAVETGERIFSSYNFTSEITIWIITEWDRKYTTILLPEEY